MFQKLGKGLLFFQFALAAFAQDMPSLKIFDSNSWWLDALSQSRIADEVFISDSSEAPKYWKKSAVKSSELKEWSQSFRKCQENLLKYSEMRKQTSGELEILGKDKNTPLESLIRKRKELKSANELASSESKECQIFVEKIINIVETRSQGPQREVHPQLGPKTFKKEDLVISLSETQRNLASFQLSLKP